MSTVRLQPRQLLAMDVVLAVLYAAAGETSSLMADRNDLQSVFREICRNPEFEILSAFRDWSNLGFSRLLNDSIEMLTYGGLICFRGRHTPRLLRINPSGIHYLESILLPQIRDMEKVEIELAAEVLNRKLARLT
ncbi:hypothetical protein KW796_00370 [Candidatus Parcubacteria bacterium]|nr:hypothetical protein [Candidatus Parcubacteria bacterium]